MATKKKIAMPLVHAVQTTLFHPPSRGAPSWEQVPHALKTRVIEALAELLLRASGVAPEPGEAVDD